MDDAVGFQLCENLATTTDEVAHGEGGVDVEDVEGVAVELMELDGDQNAHLESCPQLFARSPFEEGCQHLVVACP